MRSRSGTSDFLVTAENDGQVFAWLPPTSGSARQRETLSVAHTGKAWHRLERVQMTGGADGLAGLRVKPGSPQTADVVFWSPYELGFTTPPAILQSAPSARIASTPASGDACAAVDVKLWDSEGNDLRVSLQYQSPPNTGAWQNAMLLSLNGGAASLAVAATPQGVTHHLLWYASQDLAAAFKGGVLLRARAADVANVVAWSEPLFYTVDATTYYSTWAATHGLNGAACGSGEDFDHDGLVNLMEMAFGTNPTVSTTGVIIVNPPAIIQRGLPTTLLPGVSGDFPALFGRLNRAFPSGT